MTVLEFLSHMESGTHIHLRDITHHFGVCAKAEELEGSDFSGWHDLIVVDWTISRDGNVYIEGREDEYVRIV